MERGKRDEELRKSIQVVILACYTLYSIGLAIGAIYKGWEMGVVPILLIGVGVSWSVYINQKFDNKFSVYFYAGFITLTNFYYGVHVEAFYSVSLVIVLALLLFCLTEEKEVLRIIVLTFFLLIIYHISMIAFGHESAEDFSVALSALHIMVVLVAYKVAEYVCELLSAGRKTAEDLEHSLQVMREKSEDFMANVSHELRTPINVVTGLSSLLLKDEKSDQKRADLSAIQGAGRRLFGRIEDILDYTEVDTDSLILSEDDYRISSIINDIVTEYRLDMRPNEAEFVVDMDVNLPARMIGDAARIKRVIRHLVINARKFTGPNGCIYLSVFARRKEYGTNLCIEVTDTGIGMSTDELDKVIKGIYQSDSGRSRKADGIGLGLYVVFGFVRKMGGFVHIESEKNKGTKVCVSIPQKVIDEKPSVVLESPEKLEIVCYLRPDKYKSPAVREYYNKMIIELLKGLNIPIHKVTDFEELRSLCQGTQITHVLIAEEEYRADANYFESLKNDISVVVAVSPGFRMPKNSKATFVRKPVFSHSLVNAVNRKMSVWEFDPETSGKKLAFNGVKALVVDDEEMNLIVAKGVLAGYGMDVSVVLSGMEAVKMCERQRFDVIFMDHMMPEMDGVEAMKMIRKNNGNDDHTAIIAFTANAVSGVREMFISEGFDEFISKPIEVSELERILKKLLPSTMWQYVEVEEKEEENYEMSDDYDDDDFAARFELLNAREGRRLCRGSAALYEEMLTEFVRVSDEIMKELQTYYENKDWNNYRIKINGLKYSAKIIGADELSKEAQEIERAAIGSWEAYIVANHGDLYRKIDDIKEEVERVLGGNAS